MFFITKRKVRKMVLEQINRSNFSFNELLNKEATEQQVRDAHMLHSGQISMAITILQLIGGKKNGRINKSGKGAEGNGGREAEAQKTVG